METTSLGVAPERIYSVSELTREIKDVVEGSFPRIWVEGELSNVSLHSSGHLYLTLKDESSQIRAVMFRSRVELLGFEPEDGMHVLCRGQVGVYDVRGELRLVLDFIEPRGIGALQKAFEQLKARLHAEGLFEESRKRDIPFLPRRIGIVTSPTGAAIRDMLKILYQRYPNLHVIIRPTRVQGEGASLEIAEALDDLNDHVQPDVILLARGGGSWEDLWAFNHEEVARAIARSKAPVVTGIGHEIDFTIADFAADLRSPTPSAAAQRVVPRREDLEGVLGDMGVSLLQAMGRAVSRKSEELSDLQMRLPHPIRMVSQRAMLLDELSDRAAVSILRTIKAQKQALESISQRLLRMDPRASIFRHQETLLDLGGRLQRAVGDILSSKREAVVNYGGLLDAYSPLAVLKRGYSIARKTTTGEIIRDSSQLQKDEILNLRFHKGEATCKVESIVE
jgi:exodeoxyribonuclease VII large subunit